MFYLGNKILIQNGPTNGPTAIYHHNTKGTYKEMWNSKPYIGIWSNKIVQ